MKRALVIIVLALTSLSLHGQKHLIGLGLGATSSNVNSSNFLTETDTRIGFSASIIYQYKPSSQISIGADLNYSQRGFRNTGELNDNNGNPVGDFESRFDYDYLGLAFKLGYHMKGQAPLFFKIGIAPSYLVSAKTATPLVGGQNQMENLDVKDIASSFDLVGLLEAGIDISLSDQLILRPGLSYNHGFSSLSNENYFSSSEITNRSVNLSVSILYDLYNHRDRPQRR